MTKINAFITRLESELPDLCTPNDLISIGLFSNKQSAYKARIKGVSPDYIKLPMRGVLYPKESVIEFVKKHMHFGQKPTPKLRKFFKEAA